MGVINPITMAGFILAYTLIGIVSAFSIVMSDAGPQTDLINTAFSGNITTVDTDILDQNVFQAALEVPSTSRNMLTLLIQSLTYQAPIWQYTWAQPFQYLFLAITAAFVIVFMFFGIGLLLRVLGR